MHFLLGVVRTDRHVVHRRQCFSEGFSVLSLCASNQGSSIKKIKKISHKLDWWTRQHNADTYTKIFHILPKKSVAHRINAQKFSKLCSGILMFR